MSTTHTIKVNNHKLTDALEASNDHKWSNALASIVRVHATMSDDDMLENYLYAVAKSIDSVSRHHNYRDVDVIVKYSSKSDREAIIDAYNEAVEIDNLIDGTHFYSIDKTHFDIDDDCAFYNFMVDKAHRYSFFIGSNGSVNAYNTLRAVKANIEDDM